MHVMSKFGQKENMHYHCVLVHQVGSLKKGRERVGMWRVGGLMRGRRGERLHSGETHVELTISLVASLCWFHHRAKNAIST